MNKEQKAAAAARLKKARAERAKKVPNYGKTNLHESLHDLPKEHRFHPNKIKQWIDTQKDLAAVERKAIREKIKGATARQASHEGYVKHMQRYLRTGDWVDDFYGEYQQNKVKHICYALAYDNEGIPKRTVGTYYPDLGNVYTQQMMEEENGIRYNYNTRRRRKV